MAPKKAHKKKRSANGANEGRPTKRQNAGLTVKEVLDHDLTSLANEYWARGSESEQRGVFKQEVVDDVYMNKGLNPSSNDHARIVEILEYNSYMEEYLWPNFSAESSFTHSMSIMLIINQKFLASLPAWDVLRKDGPEKFKSFLTVLFKFKESNELSMDEKANFLRFLINIFQRLEEPMVREPMLRLVSLPLWKSLSAGRLKTEMGRFPQLRRHWKRMLKEKPVNVEVRSSSLRDLCIIYYCMLRV